MSWKPFVSMAKDALKVGGQSQADFWATTNYIPGLPKRFKKLLASSQEPLTESVCDELLTILVSAKNVELSRRTATLLRQQKRKAVWLTNLQDCCKNNSGGNYFRLDRPTSWNDLVFSDFLRFLNDKVRPDVLTGLRLSYEATQLAGVHLQEVNVSDVTRYKYGKSINFSAVDAIRQPEVLIITCELLLEKSSGTDHHDLVTRIQDNKGKLSTAGKADRLFRATESTYREYDPNSISALAGMERWSYEYALWYLGTLPQAEKKESRLVGESHAKKWIEKTDYATWDFLQTPGGENVSRETFLYDFALCLSLGVHPVRAKLDSSRPEFWLDSNVHLPIVTATAIKKGLDHPDARFFDADKLRLSSDLLLGTDEVDFQLTRYYRGAATNFAMGIYDLPTSSSPFSTWTYCLDSDHMRSLKKSLCSNHFGGNTLAFTTDGYLVLHQQTSKNFQAAGALAPSCAGSLDESDARSVTSLQDIVIKGTERELREEALVKGGLESVVSGYALSINRGFKPDFHSVTKLSQSKQELETEQENNLRKEPYVGKYYFEYLGRNREELLATITGLLADDHVQGQKIGNVLWFSLSLLRQHLETEHSLVSDLILGPS